MNPDRRHSLYTAYKARTMTSTDKLRQALSRTIGTLENLSDVEPHELDLATAIAKREAGIAREILEQLHRGKV